MGALVVLSIISNSNCPSFHGAHYLSALLRAPTTGAYPDHLSVNGNNGIVLYDVAHCWVKDVSGAHNRGLHCMLSQPWSSPRSQLLCICSGPQSSALCGRLDLLAAVLRQLEIDQSLLCHAAAAVQVRTVDADNGVILSGGDFVTITGVDTQFSRKR